MEQGVWDIGLYARVSTEDKDQNPENQLVPLRERAIKDGKTYKEFVDYESGKDIELTEREHFLKMFEYLRTGRIKEGIYVKSPSRFSRSTRDSKNYIYEIQKEGKFLFIYDRELRVDRDTKKVVLASLGFEQQANEMESALRSDQVKDAHRRLLHEAQEEAKKQGMDPSKVKVRWGRKPRMAARVVEEVLSDGTIKKKKVYDVIVNKEEVHRMANSLMSMQTIADNLGISKKLVWEILHEA